MYFDIFSYGYIEYDTREIYIFSSDEVNELVIIRILIALAKGVIVILGFQIKKFKSFHQPSS